MPPPDMNEDLEDILSDMNISSRTETTGKDADNKKDKDKKKETEGAAGKGPEKERPLAGKGKAKEPVPEMILIGAPEDGDEDGKSDAGPLDLTGVADRPAKGAAKLPTPLELLEEGDVDQTAVDQNSIMFYIQDLEEDLQEKNESLRREMERSGELQGKLEALTMELEQAKLDTLEARTLPEPGISTRVDEAVEDGSPEAGSGEEASSGAPKLKADAAMQRYIASLEDKIRERSEELETEKLERIRISNEQQVLKEALEKVQRSQAASAKDGAGAEAGTGMTEGKPEARGFELDTLATELARLKTAVDSRDKELHEWKGRVDMAEDRANKMATELTNCGPKVLGEAMRGAVERMTELETQLRATTNDLDLQRREKDEMLREIETLRARMGTGPTGPMGTEAVVQARTKAAETQDAPVKRTGRKAREAAKENAKVGETEVEAGGKGEVVRKAEGTGADVVEGEERYEWPVRGHDMELIRTIIPAAEEVPKEKDGRKEGATRLMSDYLEARGAVRGERTGVIAPRTGPRGTMVYRCECGSKVMVHANIDGDKYEDWARCPKCGKKVR